MIVGIVRVDLLLSRTPAVAVDGPAIVDEMLHGRQQLANRAGPLGVAADVVADVDLFAGLKPLGDLIGHLEERRIKLALEEHRFTLIGHRSVSGGEFERTTAQPVAGIEASFR